MNKFLVFRETQVGGPYHDLVVLNDLCLGECEFVVRVFQLTRRVFSPLDECDVVPDFLDLLSMDKTVVLCGDHMRDFSLLGVKIVHDFVCVIVSVPLGKHWVTVHGAVGVRHSTGMQFVMFKIYSI